MDREWQLGGLAKAFNELLCAIDGKRGFPLGKEHEVGVGMLATQRPQQPQLRVGNLVPVFGIGTRSDVRSTPRKRTSEPRTGISDMGHYRTRASQQWRPIRSPRVLVPDP